MFPLARQDSSLWLDTHDFVSVEIDLMNSLPSQVGYEAFTDAALASCGSTVIPDTGSTQTR